MKNWFLHFIVNAFAFENGVRSGEWAEYECTIFISTQHINIWISSLRTPKDESLN